MENFEVVNKKLDVLSKMTRHDIRNKLQVIANSIFMAKTALAGDCKALEYLDEIEFANREVNNILNFAKTYELLGAKKMAYIDVEKNIDKTCSLFPDLRDVNFVNECDGLEVLADTLLRQLFYNLFDNSFKYGEKVSRIKIYYKKTKDGLKLIYEDNGIGIPRAEREKIFDEGYGKGTGYGLYLINRMCEAYGWTIKETGKQGKGAQFTITIPKVNERGEASYRIK